MKTYRYIKLALLLHVNFKFHSNDDTTLFKIVSECTQTSKVIPVGKQIIKQTKKIAKTYCKAKSVEVVKLKCNT